MSEIVIQVENLYKKFCRSLKRSMLYGSLDITRSMVSIPYNRGKLRSKEFWALKNINLELRRGESLGIIGINGSGKSTLLRLITGIYPPDKGKITVRGRLGSLIAVGAGFHPHMTGKENIYLNGTILGMSKKEINTKLDEIVDFADIGEFLDAPVSTYSSGMYVRLGFAIAINSDPDIMLVDEVLSVGDLSFQNKCLRKIYDMKRNQKSIMFVSHAMDSVRLVCDRIILLDHGEIIYAGDTDEAIMKYYSLTREIKLKSIEDENALAQKKYNIRSDIIEFIRIGILDNNNEITKKVNYGEDINVFFEFYAKEDIEFPAVAIGIKDDRSFNIVYAYNLNYKWVKIPSFKKDNKYRVNVIFKKPNIKPGVYGFNSVILNAKTEELYLHILNKKSEGFQILSPTTNLIINGDMYPMNAVIELESDWIINKIN